MEACLRLAACAWQPRPGNQGDRVHLRAARAGRTGHLPVHHLPGLLRELIIHSYSPVLWCVFCHLIVSYLDPHFASAASNVPGCAKKITV